MRLEPELLTALIDAADKAGASPSQYARTLIAEGLTRSTSPRARYTASRIVQDQAVEELLGRGEEKPWK